MSGLQRLSQNSHWAGLQPLIFFYDFFLGFAPGWYGSRLRRFKILNLQQFKRRRRALYQPRAKP